MLKSTTPKGDEGRPGIAKDPPPTSAGTFLEMTDGKTPEESPSAAASQIVEQRVELPPSGLASPPPAGALPTLVFPSREQIAFDGNGSSVLLYAQGQGTNAQWGKDSVGNST